MNNAAQIILASASPRRSELLKQIAIRHRVCAVDLDETPLLNESPRAYVERLAREKARACWQQLHESEPLPVLAADTSVVLGDVIMGKPENQQHATEMLSALSGQTHQVYTAIALLSADGQSCEQAVSITQVTFRQLSGAEIAAYWHTGEPCDKAGAYAIQGLASIFIESIQGSFSGVMGLPLFETAQLLAKQGINVIA